MPKVKYDSFRTSFEMMTLNDRSSIPSSSPFHAFCMNINFHPPFIFRFSFHKTIRFFEINLLRVITKKKEKQSQQIKIYLLFFECCYLVISYSWKRKRPQLSKGRILIKNRSLFFSTYIVFERRERNCDESISEIRNAFRPYRTTQID